jgi:regulator of sigma E protease
MEIVIKTAQFVLSLSILVILHEFGHFFFAKLFKTRVEKFYLFFDPWFSLLKFKKGETEYGVGWLPLGGYVKISGMIDESMDKEQLKQPAQPYEFRAKSTWQRLLIMIGGVLVNFILAIVIFVFVLFTWGDDYLPNKNVTYGITCDTIAYEAGLRNGDKIISLDNQKIENFSRIVPEIVLYGHKSLKVDRNGQTIDIAISDSLISKVISIKKGMFIDARIPFYADSIVPNTVASKAGFTKDDKIIGINNIDIQFFDQFRSEIVKHINQKVTVKVLRGKDTVAINLTVPGTGILGIGGKSDYQVLNYTHLEYSLLKAVPAALSKGYHTIKDYLASMKLLFRPKTQAYKKMGGFISIGDRFPSVWIWEVFWRFTAFLSLVLAVMNILPIPALDGGHVTFLLYEIVTGRKPGDKFLEYAQIVGMVILISLIVYVNANDILRLIFK